MIFEIGGRYQNRRGEFEILDIQGPKLLVRYDDGQEQELDAETQKRIIDNIRSERRRAEPYVGADPRNGTYFRTLGFLAIRTTMIEAILPLRAVAGFGSTYLRTKGRKISADTLGVYVHPNPNVDKWGVEMRVTFRATSNEVGCLDFGPDVRPVDDPAKPAESYRINSNAFIWRLLSLGFELGPAQYPDQIIVSIPSAYVRDFQDGIADAT